MQISILVQTQEEQGGEVMSYHDNYEDMVGEFPKEIRVCLQCGAIFVTNPVAKEAHML